jgi:hypothetical protein
MADGGTSNFHKNEIELDKDGDASLDNNENNDSQFNKDGEEVTFENFYNQTSYRFMEQNAEKLMEYIITDLTKLVQCNTIMYDIQNKNENFKCVTQIFKKNLNEFSLIMEEEGCDEELEVQYISNIEKIKEIFNIHYLNCSDYNDFEKTIEYFEDNKNENFFTNVIQYVIIANKKVWYFESIIRCDCCDGKFINPISKFFHSNLHKDVDFCEDCYFHYPEKCLEISKKLLGNPDHSIIGVEVEENSVCCLKGSETFPLQSSFTLKTKNELVKLYIGYFTILIINTDDFHLNSEQNK